MKIYPKNYIEPTYGAFYTNNKAKVQPLSLVLWLEKVLGQKTVLLENLPHTNQKITSNLHCAQI